MVFPLPGKIGVDKAGPLVAIVFILFIISYILWHTARRSEEPEATAPINITPEPLSEPLEDPCEHLKLDLLKQKQGELISIIKFIAQEKTLETKLDYLHVGVAAGTSYVLRNTVRNQHVYISGKTRHGKSTLIHTMAVQDMKNGAGVCVIDAKGNLIPPAHGENVQAGRIVDVLPLFL